MGEVKQVFVSGIEVFPNGRWVVSGEWENLFDVGPVEQVARTDDLHPQGNREVGGDTFRTLFVIKSREKIEGFGLEDAFGGGFAQAGLSQKNGLPTRGDGLANGGKLFESLGNGRRTWETISG